MTLAEFVGVSEGVGMVQLCFFYHINIKVMHALQLVRAMKTVGFFDVKVVDYKAR